MISKLVTIEMMRDTPIIGMTLRMEAVGLMIHLQSLFQSKMEIYTSPLKPTTTE